MGHQCNAGCHKLVIRYDGYIIPCEAFKGLSAILPELILGHISEEKALENALERARCIPWLTCFQDHIRAATAWHAHWQQCWVCAGDDICEEGEVLLAAALAEQEEMERLMADVRRRVRESGYLNESSRSERPAVLLLQPGDPEG